MKIIKPRSDLLWTLGPLLVVISLTLLWLYTPYLRHAFYANWAFLIAIPFICVSPIGRAHLQPQNTETKRLAWYCWLGKIFLLQGFAILLFCGVVTVIAQAVPVFSKPNPELLAITLHSTLLQYGLYPWAIIAPLAAYMAYVSMVNNQHAFMSELTFPILRSNGSQIIGININSDTKLATSFALATTLAMLVFMIAHLLTYLTSPLQTGFHVVTLFSTFAIIIIIMSKVGQRFLNTVLSPAFKLSVTFLVTALMLAIIIVAANSLLAGFDQKTIKIPHLVQLLENKGWINFFWISTLCWWLGWVPAMSAYIGRISVGYRGFQVILGSLLLPVLVAVASFYCPHFNVTHPRILEIFALIGFIGLASMVMNRQTVGDLVLGYLPKGGAIKHRDPIFFMRRAIQLGALVVYLFLPAGIAAVTLVLFTATLPFALITVILLLAVLSKLIRA